jgi:exopolyphosphatase/guanosine-5'-triphosphate,3'-diphosphate pyrophosphatase
VTRVAAIDCGTNSIRLLVAEPASDRAALVEIVRRMEIVRLGEGVDRTGRLSDAALERTAVALADYAQQIERLGAERIRMVATSASRDAENADAFRSMVYSTLGVLPEVVTGDEEARLSFTGAVANLPPELPGPYLVVDVGGGSTEFVVGSTGPGSGAGFGSGGRAGATIAGAVSVDLGCVRMTERQLPGDPPTAAQIAAAQAEIEALVDGALAAVPATTARTLIGLAGSVTTIVGIALDLPEYRPERVHHARLGYAQLAKVTADLLAATRAERLAVPIMHPGRADVIGAGALIVRTILERCGFDELVASEHDILDGIAWSLT